MLINLMNLNNSSEKVQLEAVRRNGYAIKHIKSPSEKVQLEAVLRQPFSIQYIKSPSEKVQLEAVRKDGFTVTCIKSPSEKVQLEAVRRNGLVIKFLKFPSERVQLAAVHNYWDIEIFSKKKIRVGCKTYSLQEWLSFNKEEIKEMHASAPEFYPHLVEILTDHFNKSR